MPRRGLCFIAIRRINGENSQVGPQGYKVMSPSRLKSVISHSISLCCYGVLHGVWLLTDTKAAKGVYPLIGDNWYSTTITSSYDTRSHIEKRTL